MCQKQCRDENGFKCHRMSEGHQKQMMVFIENPSQFMDEFSKDFEETSAAEQTGRVVLQPTQIGKAIIDVF